MYAFVACMCKKNRVQDVDVVVLATGGAHDFPWLPAKYRQELVHADDGLMLYRRCLCPGIPRMLFNGFNTYYVTPVPIYLGAAWVAHVMTEKVQLKRTKEEMLAKVRKMNRYTKERELNTISMCLFPYFHYLELLQDMEAIEKYKIPERFHAFRVEDLMLNLTNDMWDFIPFVSLFS